MAVIRVLIADDHRLFAEALEAILAVDDRIDVVGLAADGLEAVRLANDLTPDVVLMDISMPMLDGIEAARQIRSGGRGASILMLTGSNSRSDVDRARKAGAAGYVTKDRIAAELIDAIVEISAR
ncbi:MAG TPA: response regulator transcription factor [Gaiellaceae bacterium]|jgi:two-component system response regulator DesR